MDLERFGFFLYRALPGKEAEEMEVERAERSVELPDS
jgi:hypothetical protein